MSHIRSNNGSIYIVASRKLSCAFSLPRCLYKSAGGQFGCTRFLVLYRYYVMVEPPDQISKKSHSTEVWQNKARMTMCCYGEV